MKRFWITLLIMVVLSPFVFSGGRQEKSSEPSSSDEIPTIRIVGKDFSPTDINIQFLRKLEEGLEAYSGQKVKLELVEVPEGAYKEKLNLMLLGGDIPDLIYFQGGDEAVSKQGLLVDLKPYVDNSSVMQKVLMDFNKQRLENYPYLLWIAPLEQG